MSRGQKLDPVIPKICMVEKRQPGSGPFGFGEWRQLVEVGGRRYKVTLRRGERVRIPYKPAGQNWGHRWVADVWRADVREGEKSNLWNGEVSKSAGVRGILLLAGIVTTEPKWWGDWYRSWFNIGRAAHVQAHPECRDPEDRRFGRREPWTCAHVCQLTCAHPFRERGRTCPRCGARWAW